MKALVFKGATKPAMLWGIPQTPLILLLIFSATLTLILMSWTDLRLWGTLFMVLPFCCIPYMRAITKKDDQMLNLFLIEMKEKIIFFLSGNKKGKVSRLPAQNIIKTDT